MNDNIFYSAFELAKPTSTNLINRKTNEEVQLEETIDLILDSLYEYITNIYNNKMNKDCFIFMESIENQSYYTFGQIKEDTLDLIRLPYTYKETDDFSFYDDHTIFFTKNNENSNLDFYVITNK